MQFPLKLFLLLLSAGFLLSSCGGTRNIAGKRYQQRFVPAPLKDLYLGMPLQAALEAHPGMKPDQEESFRLVYLEHLDDKEVETIAYYFDSDPPNTLYEYIINYRSAAARDRAAASLLGPPNHNGDEWMLDSQEGFRINAWTFQNKLILAGKIAGTEWEE